jgi:anti-sigma regulatory factor (Ser/Thr protein kinase)
MHVPTPAGPGCFPPGDWFPALLGSSSDLRHRQVKENMRASKVFEPVPAQVREARRFVASVLQTWGMEADDVVLLVSELATNAVLHARSEFKVHISQEQDRVRVEVSDDNSRLPSFVAVPNDANSGRGLLLLQTMSGAWGVESHGDGKTIWFELPVPV